MLPPAGVGDIARAVRRGPRAIALIDGMFERVLPVWHKEILWAMARGVHVFGAASMGALRAAELHAFGMQGVGRIFEAYRYGELEADDEVAVLHGPADLGFVAVTEALVNVRATLRRARRRRPAHCRCRSRTAGACTRAALPRTHLVGAAAAGERRGVGTRCRSAASLAARRPR